MPLFEVEKVSCMCVLGALRHNRVLTIRALQLMQAGLRHGRGARPSGLSALCSVPYCSKME